MGITTAMQAGVTALAANATALSAISSNIANVNTTGYKRVTSHFTDLVSGQSTKGSYTGSGVTATTQQNVTTKGELIPTTSGYNLGIDGQGFFIVSDTTRTGTSATSLFSRDGSFTTDTNGYMVNAGGYYLKGWLADQYGNIATSSTDMSMLQAINVGNVPNPILPTRNVSFNSNLDSRTPISSAAATYSGTDPVPATPANPAVSMSSWLASDVNSKVGTKPDTSITLKVSDSLGQPHNVTLALIKLSAGATGSTWAYEVWSDDAVAGAGLPAGQIASGQLTFDNEGNLQQNPAPPAAQTFTGALADPAGLNVQWNPSFGAVGTQQISFGVSGDPVTSTLTSVGRDTLTSAQKADGTEFSPLAKVEIQPDGTVNAVYSNGNVRTIAKVALATFVNANGLEPLSGNVYAISSYSGSMLLKTPGADGAGQIAAATLENSTVDLSQEFTGLITTQRAYSAASKIVTTADEMLQELLNIKR